MICQITKKRYPCERGQLRNDTFYILIINKYDKTIYY